MMQNGLFLAPPLGGGGQKRPISSGALFRNLINALLGKPQARPPKGPQKRPNKFKKKTQSGRLPGQDDMTQGQGATQT